MADRFFERKDNQPFAQASDQDRRPIFMIANLEGDHTTLGEAVDFRLEIGRTFFDIGKSSCNFPTGIKDRGESFARATVCLQAASKPSLDFISCASSSARLDFALVSENESRHSSRVLRD